MKIEKLEPECNLTTVTDGRGGIFTFYPKDPLVEVNFIFIKSGKVRGHHYHPEFDEYYFITNGEGVIVTKDTPDSKEEFLYVSRGHFYHIPKNVRHVVYAITDMAVMAMLTKKWNDCDVPIVHEKLVKDNVDEKNIEIKKESS